MPARRLRAQNFAAPRDLESFSHGFFRLTARDCFRHRARKIAANAAMTNSLSRCRASVSAPKAFGVRRNALQFSCMEDAPTKMPHVAIVGAGLGGLEAAKKLACEKVRETVIARPNYHLSSRCSIKSRPQHFLRP